jgi:hypothetical protein
MKKKYTDAEIDAALLAFWKSRDPIGADEVTLNSGTRIKHLRTLARRCKDGFERLEQALDPVDPKKIDRALDIICQPDDKYEGHGVESVLQDAEDLVDALREFPPQEDD